MAELLIAGRAQEFRLLADHNPMDWLDQKPGNYLGVLSGPGTESVSAGNWYFDSSAKELVYSPNNASHFQSNAAGRKRIRLHLVPRRNSAAPVGEGGNGALPTDAVALETVEPYFWF